MGKEARKQVVDTKVVRGAEIGSDHYLILLKIKLRAKRRSGGEGHAQTRGKIRINRLKDNDVRREFQVVIGEMYEGARVRGHLCGSDVELAWKEMKDCLVKTATRVCGVSKRRKGAVKRTKWWNEEVRCAVRRKKVMYKRLLDTGTVEAKQMYNKAKLEAKNAVRRAKNEEWVKLGRELEKDASRNQQKFWAKVNGSRRTKEGVTHVYDKNGKVLSEGEEVVKRWKEHFERLYQEMDGPGLHMPNGATTVLEGDLEIMKEEVRRSVRRLKMRKAPGICGIVPETLKAGGEVMVEWMVKLFNLVWRVGVVPGDWIKAVIIPIFKKGSRLDCANYRGISLLSIVGKVFGRILNERVKAITDVKVMDEQGGFRAGRGCNDQIFVVKQIVEKTIEKNKKIYMAFVDLEKAYDNVSREKLWVVLDKYGIKGSCLGLFRHCMWAVRHV